MFAGGRVYPEDFSIGNEEFEDWDDVFKKYPNLKGNSGHQAQLFLRINVETGHVDNWPANKTGNFETVKVVDEGIYVLKDYDLNEIVTYEGYVPDCMEIERHGYGDYWEFKINKKGFIENWHFSQEDVNELFDVDNE